MYWKPPSVISFDPVPQPLTWEFRDGQRMPTGIDGDSYVWNGYGVPLFKGGSGQANQRIVTQSDADKLKYYQRIIDVRAPEDPVSGGLAGDSYDPATGEIRINYIDASDDNWPKRKKVSYYPQGAKGVKVSIIQWNPNQQVWETEGYDFQKEFLGALPDIIKAFGAITSAIIGFITANPVLTAAWNQVFQSASAPVFGGPPPSLTDFAQAAGGYLGAAPGFGDAMADLSKNKLFKQSMFGNVGKLASDEVSHFGHEVTSYLDKLRKTAEDFAHAFPSIDIGAAAKGVIPPDVQHAAENAAKGLTDFDLNSYKFATKAFFTALTDETVAAIRKAASDKPTFDTTYATLQAQMQRGNQLQTVSQGENFPTITMADRFRGVAIGQKENPAITPNINPALADLISYVRQLELKYGI